MRKSEKTRHDCQLCWCHGSKWQCHLHVQITKSQRTLSHRKPLWSMERLQKLCHCKCANSLVLQWLSHHSFTKNSGCTASSFTLKIPLRSHPIKKAWTKEKINWVTIKKVGLKILDWKRTKLNENWLHQISQNGNVWKNVWWQDAKIKGAKSLKIRRRKTQPNV